MSQGKEYGRWWLFVSALLIAATIAGGVMLGLRQWGGSKPAEIALSSTPALNLGVYLSGAVANEGIYTFSEDSSLGDVLQRAGGMTEEADLANISIHIPTTDESLLIEPQKVNINTAEAWLLEALPGIGATLAQRIIEYRENNGPFQNIDELTRVEGIGTTTLEKIRDKITVIG